MCPLLYYMLTQGAQKRHIICIHQCKLKYHGNSDRSLLEHLYSRCNMAESKLQVSQQ